MTIKRISVLILALSMIGMVVFMFKCHRGPNGSRNQHVWILPNNERINYYELKDKSPGFTASVPSYVTWTSSNRGTNTTEVGVGGSFANVELHINQKQTVAWITGQDAGQMKKKYLAVLDLVMFKVIDDYCMWGLESHMNANEVELKHEIVRAVTTAALVPEYIPNGRTN